VFGIDGRVGENVTAESSNDGMRDFARVGALTGCGARGSAPVWAIRRRQRALHATALVDEDRRMHGRHAGRCGLAGRTLPRRVERRGVARAFDSPLRRPRACERAHTHTRERAHKRGS
jgi:hypothetical protein